MIEDLIEDLKGLQIVGGRSCVDGFHFELSDGRLLIIAGEFAMGVCDVEETVH